MKAVLQEMWHEANQQYLMQEVHALRASLLQHADPGAENPPPSDSVEADKGRFESMALEQVCARFELSRFERKLLILCAGVELDGNLAELVASMRTSSHPMPTFGFALSVLPEPHWSALSPGAPLRHWRLLKMGNGDLLTASPLRIDERILHFIAGVSHREDRLCGLARPVESSAGPDEGLRDQIASITRSLASSDPMRLPIVRLQGDDRSDIDVVASSVCSAFGMRLYAISAADVPQETADVRDLVRLFDRECLLEGAALLVEQVPGDSLGPARDRAVARLLDEIGGLVFTTHDVVHREQNRKSVSFRLNRRSAIERTDLWQRALGDAAVGMNGQLNVIASQFELGGSAIRAACEEALASDSDDLATALWASSRRQARPAISELAHWITANASWDDLVLPASEVEALRAIAIRVRQRWKVCEKWGFAHKNPRGLGTSALFCGPSGTGKTLAAEVLANELKLDLYRVDLSQLVSKYIGETEKNLSRVFDAAERGCGILLFDEADAIFGKRSEVKDSHDRYANLEVSYLLQRMEAYRGLAILTTNMQDAMDRAFMRRLRFVVRFPFPDEICRAEIWKRIFPPKAPVEALDYIRLAQLQAAGGHIQNIALHAAFLAAESDRPISMEHLLQAAHREYANLGRAPSDAEIRGWA
jgi:hypothetical protein